MKVAWSVGGLYLCHQGTAKGLWFNISSIKDTEKETEIHSHKKN